MFPSRSNGARIGRRLALVLISVLAASCASVEAPLSTHLESGSDAVKGCARWFADLDDAVADAGVGDAAAYRIPGFPYLRADRFTASFAGAAATDDAAFHAWVDRLVALDREARRVETINLPQTSLHALGVETPADAMRRTEACSATLMPVDLASADQRARLLARSRVPDDYSDWQRVVGLYPLVKIPFGWGVESAQQQSSSLIRQAEAASEGTPATAATGGPILRYEPAGEAVGPDRVTAVFAEAGKDAIGIPRFTEEERSTLLQAFAPVFEIGSSGPYDHFGPLAWKGTRTPSVDVDRPAVYGDLAFARYGDEVLVQAVYTLWFPERPDSGWLDALSGHLDGVVFRVTLDATGRPLLYDTIHPCGCYHMFFPTDRLAVRPAPEDEIEWAFIPARAPAVIPPQRIAVTTQSRTHYVVRVAADSGGSATPYTLLAYDDLRSLPAGGGRRSAFGPDGLVAGTERGERLLFWPMGIESAGAMRQSGRQATAFTGRRHFDDPDLIERRFVIAPAPTEASS